MKNLSVQEKKDLDTCVFQALGKNDSKGIFSFITIFIAKIKAYFYSK